MPVDPMPSAGSAGVSATGYSAQIPAGGPQQDPPVWTGHTGGLLDPITGAPKPYTTDRHVGKPSSEVIGKFNSWTNKRKKELAKKLALAGYFGTPPMGMSLDDFVARIPLAKLEEAWAQVVMETAQKNANGVWVTPEQNIQQQIDYNRGAAAGTEFEGFFTGKAGKKDQGFTGTKKQTSISRDIFSASEAKGVIRGVLQQELGRDPTAEEFEDFVDALQTKQKKNPQRNVATAVYRKGDLIRSTSRTTGGIDPTEYATEWAQSQPDWAEWQAVGTYFPTVLNTLGAAVPGA